MNYAYLQLAKAFAGKPAYEGVQLISVRYRCELMGFRNFIICSFVICFTFHVTLTLS